MVLRYDDMDSACLYFTTERKYRSWALEAGREYIARRRRGDREKNKWSNNKKNTDGTMMIATWQ
jgi:hypothetical protein